MFISRKIRRSELSRMHFAHLSVCVVTILTIVFTLMQWDIPKAYFARSKAKKHIYSTNWPPCNFQAHHTWPKYKSSVSEDTHSFNTEDQLPLDFTLQNHTGYDATWQPVAGSVHKLYVYSAFYDSRKIEHRVVRIIGITKTNKTERVECNLYYNDPTSNSVTEVTVTARILVIRDNWNLEFSAAFFLCPLSDSRVPESVAVVATASKSEDTSNTRLSSMEHMNVIGRGSKPSGNHGGGSRSQPSNQLQVLNPNVAGSNGQNNKEVGVCVKQMRFSCSNKMELVQFIELNKLLGVMHFTFYKHTLTEDVSCMLKAYIEKGEVTVLQWNLDFISLKSIHEEGQMAAQNDCLYRNMNSFNYLGFYDVDEFIVPHGSHKSIPGLIKYLHKVHSKEVPASFSFQNAFFHLFQPDDELAQDGDLGLPVLRKTRRNTQLNLHDDRSKYICIPHRVNEVGVHVIYGFTKGKTIYVSPEDGFLHHYRMCEANITVCTQRESKVDRTLTVHRDNLVGAVKTVLDDVAEQC